MINSKYLNIYLSILSVVLISSCELFDIEDVSFKKEKNLKVYNGVRKNYIKGKLASTVTYKDSLKNGPAINYYPNGKINMKFNYKNNLKDGDYEWFYENGNLYISGQYTEGEKDGLFKTYRKNGTLKAEMPWNSGNPCKGLKEYFESGNLKPAPIIVVKHRNTVKLDGKYVLEMQLSDKSKNASFFEGGIEGGCLSNYYITISTIKGKGKHEFHIYPGNFLMTTIPIVAKVETRDKNIYVLEKKINIAEDNR